MYEQVDGGEKLRLSIAFLAVTLKRWSSKQQADDSRSLQAAVAAIIFWFSSDSVRKFRNCDRGEFEGDHTSTSFPRKSETFPKFSFWPAECSKQGGSIRSRVIFLDDAGYFSRFCAAICIAAHFLKFSTNVSLVRWSMGIKWHNCAIESANCTLGS